MDNKQEKLTTDRWFEHYRVKRSIEFIEQYNAKASWKKLQARKNKKKKLRIAYQVSAAASILLLFAATYFMWDDGSSKTFTAQEVEATYHFPETGARKAVLTLSDGQEVDLTKKEGEIHSNDKAIAHSKANELLDYTQEKATKPAEKAVVEYNTLTVPRGGEYQLILSDGTKVWLNAESKLVYPVHFTEEERTVILSGEAYFEVTKEGTRPFVVQVNNNRVEVLGTKFNISAYPGNNIYTTLSEGSVGVYSESRHVILHPDEQAVIISRGVIRTKEVDARAYISWVQGIYEFKETNLSDIMNQLSRWYDVDIVFENTRLKQKQFTGAIFRKDELNFAVEIIEKVSDVKFTREDNTIFIINK